MGFRSALDGVLGRAAAQPEAPALLVDGRLAHTYGSLARAALRTGAILRDRGAGPEDIVGIALPRSAELVVAMLGAWAAGAAFTVLDPAQPAARRAVQIREGRIRRIVTTSAHRAGLAAVLGERERERDAPDTPDAPDAPDTIEVIELGHERIEPLAGPVPVAAEHLAYVYWTSGSTGRPKGVAVAHRGLPGMLHQQATACGLGPGQRTLLVLGIGFDASLADVGVTLLSGACLCIESALGQPGVTVAALLALMRERAITYVDIPPALLALLDPAEAPPGLATVLYGGEVCPAETVRAWAGRVRLISAYGPTEATICTSMCVCTPAWDRPLLGTPLAGVRYRVLDPDRREVPDGQPGQLAIGGVPVARGYLGQPALQAARFVTIGGARWFLTGDLVVREGGEYRFLGRMDRQVKVRGQLVAPEEIEAALVAHPDVAGAHVHARTRATRTALHAFVAARPGARPAPEALRRHLSERLPVWMLPQRIEVVDALPATASGKLDGEALAALARAPLVAGDGRASGDAERALARVAAQVLGVAEVDLRRGFVSLGGDSLAIIEMAAACAAAGVTASVPVSAAELAADVPLRELARGRPAGSGMPAALLDQAAALPADIAAAITERAAAPAPPAPPLGPAAILITGATGYLGARLVLELGRRSRAALFCLVRAHDAGHAWQRLRAACDAHEPGGLDALGKRVRAIAGDVAAPGLGLDAGIRDELAHAIEAVYHCAAQVNMVMPFATLAPHNLGGTAEILRLCLHGRRKRLHHVSTLSVFVSTDRGAGHAEEADDLGATGAVFGGYAQSKWAAERLVQRAARGLPVAVYRLGLITGDPERGPLPPRDSLALLTRGLASVRAVPASWLDAVAIDVTPLGFAAAALAAIGLCTSEPAIGTYHVAGRAPVPLRAWVRAMRAAGAVIDELSDHDWQARAARAGLAGWFALLSLSGGRASAALRPLETFQAADLTFDTRRADAALRGSGVERPAATPELLTRYVQRILEEVT